MANIREGKVWHYAFPWWDQCGIRLGNNLIPLCPISPEYMDALYSKQDSADIVGVPVYIAKRPEDEKLRVFPRPVQDFTVEKV